MRITIHRGPKEIGGTLVELKTANTRVLIDAGFPLFWGGKPIDDKLARESHQRLLELGVLPPIHGLYEWDEPSFDAVLVSHAYIDHFGLLKYVHPRIPIWLSAGERTIVEITQRFRYCDIFATAGPTFKMDTQFPVGDFVIKSYLMDHAGFDAAAFQLTAEGKTLIYTGDFRGRGSKSVCLDRFIELAAKHADALLLEGDTLGRPDEAITSEDALAEALIDQGLDFKGPILFQCSSQNIDRLVGFYRAAQQLKRTFVIDIYTANVLHDLRKLGNKHLPCPSEDFPDIKVFYPHSLTDKIFKQIGAEYAKRFSAYYIDKETIVAKQGRLMMMARPSMIRDLERCGLHDGLFFYSQWNGYRDADHQRKFEASLRQSGFALRALHTSGHTAVADTLRLIRELDPQRVIAIHTSLPEAFREFSAKTVLVKDREVLEV